MAKPKTSFFCQKCGAQYLKWQGQCNVCKEWGSIIEEVVQATEEKTWKENGVSTKAPKAIKLERIDTQVTPRIMTEDKELDRVLGGGIVPGSVILLGGEPGIGKSTLLLQIAMNLKSKVIYVSGEESAEQIKLRSDRLGLTESNCYVLCQTNLELIFNQIKKLSPRLVIIDSIQTLSSSNIESVASSVSQIRTCTGDLIEFAKNTQTPVFIIGHITKDGLLAGPKVLEHMVDTVLHFEGDRNYAHRILRTRKNRFGATSQIGIYKMDQTGLVEVENPSELLISEKDQESSGHAIAVTIEGSRPLLIEIQALVSSAVYGTPQRSCTGFNTKRLQMLLAVLEKRAGFTLGTKDVFVNITGGIKLEDPSIDLAVIVAILSSYYDIPIPRLFCFAAEIGLSGEIRSVPRVELRIQEAKKLGYQQFILSKYNKFSHKIKGLELGLFGQIDKLIKHLFAN